MKYYESTLNEYVEMVSLNNIHKDNEQLNELHRLNSIENTIFYGPSGVGKYSQVLYLLSKKIGKFKSQQKLYVQKDSKDKYTYIMSDIYFEIDMGLLGCNSKTLWHEIYLQILDIVIIKPKRTGIIVCKNFHLIHSELLDIFYSYIQDNYKGKSIQIKYIIITEQISFISNNILNNFIIINIPRLNIDIYKTIIELNTNKFLLIDDKKLTNIIPIDKTKSILTDIGEINMKNTTTIEEKCQQSCDEIVNIKDIFKNGKEINMTLKIICNNIIEQIENSDKIIITQFRDILYELLTYSLDISESIWHVLSYFYKKEIFNKESLIIMMESIYDFLKKFNNNYRPITHLESIFILFILYYRKYSGLSI